MSRLTDLKEKMSFQAILLAVFALVASAFLGISDLETRDVIALRLQEDLKKSLESVVPTRLYDNDLLNDTKMIASDDAKLGQNETLVYLARKNGELVAGAFSFAAMGGYSGDIKLIMGVDVSGNILGVRVISHAETPGLGDKIEIEKSNWITGFNQHSLTSLTQKQWAVKKDGGEFDQFTGATITPRAVVNGVYQGLQFFNRHLAELQSKE